VLESQLGVACRAVSVNATTGLNCDRDAGVCLEIAYRHHRRRRRHTTLFKCVYYVRQDAFKSQRINEARKCGNYSDALPPKDARRDST